MDFPTLSRKPTIYIEEKSQLKTLRSPTEYGYVVTRPMWTRPKRVFHVRYDILSLNDWNTLKDFFETSTKGGSESFNWVHPITNATYVVRFLSDTLSSTMVAINYVKVEFDLEEV